MRFGSLLPRTRQTHLYVSSRPPARFCKTCPGKYIVSHGGTLIHIDTWYQLIPYDTVWPQYVQNEYEFKPTHGPSPAWLIQCSSLRRRASLINSSLTHQSLYPVNSCTNQPKNREKHREKPTFLGRIQQSEHRELPRKLTKYLKTCKIPKQHWQGYWHCETAWFQAVCLGRKQERSCCWTAKHDWLLTIGNPLKSIMFPLKFT